VCNAIKALLLIHTISGDKFLLLAVFCAARRMMNAAFLSLPRRLLSKSADFSSGKCQKEAGNLVYQMYIRLCKSKKTYEIFHTDKFSFRIVSKVLSKN